MKSWQNPIEHVLHAHSRAISDVNFSAHHPDVIATCAVDSFVHCWDLRTPARPVVSFSDWIAGATQVKWNRQDPHVIASSHDRYLKIWDDRKGAYPLRTIEAHNTKIYGVDWNRMRPEAVVTCSLDKTIKFWDYSKDTDVPEKVIHAPFPVWRARHTPFGLGVLVMPQRGNSDLHLYSRAANANSENPDELSLVHSFPGHKGQVKEFLWRPRGTVLDGLDHREFQLVSWGTDRELRLHRVNPDVLRGVGYETGKSFNAALNITRDGAVYKTFRDEPNSAEHEDGSVGPQKYQARITGMSGISMPYTRGWTQAGGGSAIRADMNPISWMRGVKISGWEVETLGDEISHVGEKFSKVAFESVNVGQRKTTISLHGPWGPDNTNIFLKIDMKFPPSYPRNATPIFNVQKTASMTSQLTKTVSNGLQAISEAYMAKKRGSLEGILRFLLGEHAVDESVAIAQRGLNEPLKSPELYDDEDSSDEDEDVGQFQGDDLGMSSSELLRPVNANVMVPVRRTCGAVWANDGRLVCFFPPKKEKPSSFLGSMGLNEMTRLSRNDRVFEAFGRLRTGSPGPKNSNGTGTGGLTATDDGGSDFSDDSSIVSSSSSGSSDLLGSLPQQFHGPQTWRSSVVGYYRSKSTDNSQKSTTGVPTVKSTPDGPHNTIAIHDLEELLPSKRNLAEQYRMAGDRGEICSHNMTVCMDSGNLDLARVWGLIKLMLQNQISPVLLQEDDIIVIARAVAIDGKRKEGAALPFDSLKKRKSPPHLKPGKINWGENPFGGRWLVPALFAYFERLGDIQTLAMLSCIFYEPESKELEKGPSSDQTSLTSVRNRSFSVSYSTPAARLQAQSQNASPVLATAKDLISTSQSSACSEPWPVEPPPLPLTGTTPPMTVRSARASLEKRARQVVSLAGSPDQRFDHRTGSNYATTVASSLSRSFTYGPHSGSSSPPIPHKKKPSPAGSLTAAGPAGWSSAGFFGKPASAVPDYLTASTTANSQALSDMESERQDSPGSTKPNKGIKITIKNQEMFDSDNKSYVPMINEKQQALYHSYRQAYANLLFVWGMPIEQSEVLRIEAIAHNRLDLQQECRREKSPVSVGRNRKLSRTAILESNAHVGVNIRLHCSQCNSVIDPYSPSTTAEQNHKNKLTAEFDANKCERCAPTQPISTNISCIICTEIIQGMITPCLNCGHVTCLECHRQWFILPSQDPSIELPSCASGCGCNCSEHLTVEVPRPPSPPPIFEELVSSTQTQTKTRSKSRKPRPVDSTRANDKWTAGHDSLLADDEGDQPEQWFGLPSAPLVRGGNVRSNNEQDRSQKHHHRRKTSVLQSGDGTSPSRTAWDNSKLLLERMDTM